MNYEDTSSDDVPYLPAEQFQEYENQQRNQARNSASSSAELRKGRSHFTEDEILELDAPESSSNGFGVPGISTIPLPAPNTRYANAPIQDDIKSYANNTPPQPIVTNNIPRPSVAYSEDSNFPRTRSISWGRRLVGLLLVTIPAVLFSVAAHFVDWRMSNFQLFSASLFIFLGVFLPSVGIYVIDLCLRRKKLPEVELSTKGHTLPQQHPRWVTALWLLVHSNLSAVTAIFIILSIQHLNISVALALTFGFDVIVLLTQYIIKKRRCSWELVLLSVTSYCGYAVVSIPAFASGNAEVREHTAIGAGAAVGAMLLSIPTTFALSRLRKDNVSDAVLGSSFGLFGCIHSLITKAIMGNTSWTIDGRSVGWAAGLVAVVFLGTIFVHLESRLSALIWQRDDDRDDKKYSSITRTRIAVFLLSCLWELSRQSFRDTHPDPYDIIGGLLVMLSFLLSGGFKAWSKYYDTESTVDGSESRPNFCAFIPWLFTRQ